MGGRRPSDEDERQGAGNLSKRSAALALLALAVWAVFSFVLPWASAGSTMAMYGLPLRSALAIPVGLPVLVLTMFWFAARQGAEDEQAPDDD